MFNFQSEIFTSLIEKKMYKFAIVSVEEKKTHIQFMGKSNTSRPFFISYGRSMGQIQEYMPFLLSLKIIVLA